MSHTSTSITPEKVGTIRNLFPYLEDASAYPRLPVPDIHSTFAKYLATVRAISTDEEYENTKKLVTEFENSAEIQRLQRKLHQLDAESPSSWLEGLWDTMYLELRCPVMVHVSPYYAIHTDVNRRNQVSRAAGLIASSVRFHDLIINQKLEPDMERDTKLDMSQYGKLLGACRIPLPGRDSYTESIKGEFVVVVCNNQFYEVRCRDANSQAPVPEEELLVHLEAIVQDAHNYIETTPVGVFTADDRDPWATARAELIKNPVNKASLKAIEDALIVVCLDENAIHNLTDVSKMLLHGNGRNRWFDKSVQIMIGTNGEAGILMEHTRFDGHTILKYTDFIYNDSAPRAVLQPAQGVQPHLGKLKWSLSSASLQHLQEAEKRVDALIGSVDTFVMEFNDWGKGLIKGFRMSPDAFVQMAYQLAYYRMRGQPGSTYESGNTKRFYHGRTTCIRSCSVESVAFTKVFCDAQSTKEEKLAALQKAVDQHVRLSGYAKMGQDIDRPLFGWYHMARFEQQKFINREIPAIYKDPVYARMKTDMLSTSNSSGSPALTMFGFGPTSSTGFGLGYVVDEDYINVCVTSFTGEAKKYGETLRQALLDMAALFE